MKMRTVLLALSVLLASCGGTLLARHGYMRAKAAVAESLIARSFDAHLRDGKPHRPWGWADMYPVARLEVERLNLHRHVLTGATGASLAFGLGHLDGTALPNGSGNCVVAGHRDSWATFLRELRPGDTVKLLSRGRSRTWLVSATEVVDSSEGAVLFQDGGDTLTLVTCFPFGGLTRSNQRYVVTCSPATSEPVMP